MVEGITVIRWEPTPPEQLKCSDTTQHSDQHFQWLKGILMNPSTLISEPSLAPLSLAERFQTVRNATTNLCAPLETEDFVVSSMSDVSPTKWHLAHTSWFFETFLLAPHMPSYVTPNPRYAFLFNSYYVQAGERHCRAQRGLVTRPTVREIFEYRKWVDDAVLDLCEQISDDTDHPAWEIIELGIHHEQQHQELLVTDIKHVFWTNPLRPAYRLQPLPHPVEVTQNWHKIRESVRTIGKVDDGFSFDNERPAHKQYVNSFALAHRLVTNAEFASFIDDGGYRKPALWLDRGWSAIQESSWKAPLYWERVDNEWHEFTMSGVNPLIEHAPVTHVSYYEADAFARWAGYRLPTEAEWETVAREFPVTGRFAGNRAFHPLADDTSRMQQLYGDAWQWTASAYLAYPGFKAATGAIGEYNGKWMSDQWVLRGASCATPESHARLSYRNFFPSDVRWQFTGIRLAADS